MVVIIISNKKVRILEKIFCFKARLLFCFKTVAETAEPFVYNITVPKDDKEKACLKMEATFSFGVTYLARIWVTLVFFFNNKSPTCKILKLE
jgi:hypothetical protein